MEPEMILDFVKETGYKTKQEIEGNFTKYNTEIVNMQLEYLTGKKLIGKVVFSSVDGHGTLYYLIYHKEG